MKTVRSVRVLDSQGKPSALSIDDLKKSFVAMWRLSH